MRPLIEDNLDEIGRLCRLHGVRKLEVFGSILREDFDPQRSDVDVLVEFEPRAANSFANFLDFKEALENLFKRRPTVNCGHLTVGPLFGRTALPNSAHH